MKCRRKEGEGGKPGEDQRAGKRLTGLISSGIPGPGRWKRSSCYCRPVQDSALAGRSPPAQLPIGEQRWPGSSARLLRAALAGVWGIRRRAWPGLLTIELFA